MFNRFLLAIPFLFPVQSFAQSASERIALGDKAYAALDANVALAHYEAAAAADPQSYAAQWKSSRSLMDISSLERNPARRDSLYGAAEKYARRAIQVSPNHAEGHFSLARALGKTALTQSPKGRVRYAKDIRNEALKCLALDPKHAGCLHVMGMWNAEVRRLNGVVRTVARTFLGGQIFGSATWEQAIRYMEQSIAEEPNRIAHHIDLAEIYHDAGYREKARAEFETVLRLPVIDLADANSKAHAREALKRL
jgi:tetratricopeptide (TPR) repeat protein